MATQPINQLRNSGGGGTVISELTTNTPLQFTKGDSGELIRSKYDNPDRPTTTDQAREQVRKAVLYSLTRRPFSTLAKGLSPSDWNLDGFRSRFYRQFEAKQDAVEDTLRAGIQPDRSELTDALTAQMAKFASAIDDGTAQPSDVLLALGDAYFTQSINDDCLSLQMLAWVAAREHTALQDDFINLYSSLDHRTVDGLRAMLEAWGRTPIEPFTWSDIATTLTALTEGLLIRHAVDPDKAPTTLLGQVSIAIVSGMTRQVDDVEHIRDRIDPQK